MSLRKSMARRTIETSYAKKAKGNAVRSRLLEDIRTIREKIDPVLLDKAHQMIMGDAPENVPVDREHNIRTVMAFLNSPAGEHFREKVFGSNPSR
jgi:hypothetical protein